MASLSTILALLLGTAVVQDDKPVVPAEAIGASPADTTPKPNLATETPSPDAQPESSAAPSPEKKKLRFQDLFTEKSYRYTGGGYKDREFKYQLYVPEISDESEHYPLLVWLHGVGEAGSDNRHHLRYLDKLIFTPPREKSRFPFFLLAVQCPKDNSVWTTSSSEADDMVNVADAILEASLQEYPIDPDRVSLSGISSGGNGTWEMAMRFPDRFSAIAPISSGGGDNARVDRLVGIPVWAFHSHKDQKPPIDLVQQTITALEEAGGIAHLMEVNMSPVGNIWGHDAWTEAFGDYGLLEWLLAQRRGDEALSPQRYVLQRKYLNWDYLWPRSIPVAVLMVGVIAWRFEKRRRKTASGEPMPIEGENHNAMPS